MSRSMHIPAGIFDSRHFGFAQVAVTPTPFGQAVHVAGQVAWDADRNIVGAGDIGRQLEKSLENLALALASVVGRLPIAQLRKPTRRARCSARQRCFRPASDRSTA